METTWEKLSSCPPAPAGRPPNSAKGTCSSGRRDPPYQGEHHWATMLGQCVRLQPVHIQTLSELERARLQEVAHCHLEDRERDCKITIPREHQKRRKSMRRRFDSFSKEKKEQEMAPKAFGIALSQVIANDRVHKQRQDALKESRRDYLDPGASVLHFRPLTQQLSGSLAPCLPPAAPQEPNTCPSSSIPLHKRLWALRRALQLSHPYELEGKRSTGRAQAQLSLNPIYGQVPRILEHWCRHIEAHGLQTVGIFRVGSSRKRIRQLREDFDLGVLDVLDAEHSVHDVAALLKEFLRDMSDSLLPTELYSAFLHANSLSGLDQLSYLQHLLYLLPPCNCDTLLRLLTLLHTVQCHAQDSIGPDNQEIPGNKMTAMNLAVIFGPNLLQRKRGSQKEKELHTMEAEDSTDVIAVTLILIKNYRELFMVSAALQQEVLLSLLQTDPEIIDYLLGRKLSSNLRVDTEAGGRWVTKASLDSMGLSSGQRAPLNRSSSQTDSSFSSKLFFSMLRLNQYRKRSTADSPQRSIAQIRPFHSHHNLLSLVRPIPQSEDHTHKDSLGEEDLKCRAMGEVFSPAEKTLLFCLGQDSSTSQTLATREPDKPQSTTFCFLSRKSPGSDSIV
ncbi:hypothetical protein AAFF_G00312660 [Aldrovandia affinis]|uniref:Rho-GAP domain-containing protein n=1 Tax=Aldrovandia affinis TaxID=143900 RepID=A0AAD7SNI5_9TELE|nr:hypothetical protein AAFF_G00312660 [Aldrovandia affinis]